MNYRLILNTIGKVLRIEGALMLLPAIVSLIYKEWSEGVAFFVVLLGAILVGQILVSFVRIGSSTPAIWSANHTL